MRRVVRLIVWGLWALLFGIVWYAINFENAAVLGLVLASTFLIVTCHDYWSVLREAENASVYASYALTAALFGGLDYIAFSMCASGEQFEVVLLAWVGLAGAAAVIVIQIVLFITARIHAGRAN